MAKKKTERPLGFSGRTAGRMIAKHGSPSGSPSIASTPKKKGKK